MLWQEVNCSSGICRPLLNPSKEEVAKGRSLLNLFLPFGTMFIALPLTTPRPARVQGAIATVDLTYAQPRAWPTLSCD